MSTNEISVNTQPVSQHFNCTQALMNPATMEQIFRFAQTMAGGAVSIPKHLQGNVSDCMAIVIQSMQWGMLPFSVAQKTHVINGVMGYEAQLVAAVINSSGLVVDRFNFDWYGPWEKVIGKFDVKRGDKGEYRVPAWSFSDEIGCGVKVWATLRGETKPRVLDLQLAQARTRNSTLWADDPRQQLAYLAQKRWARLYAPDVILGVYTPDEIQYRDADAGIIDINEAPQDQPLKTSVKGKAAKTKLAAEPVNQATETVEVSAEVVLQAADTVHTSIDPSFDEDEPVIDDQVESMLNRLLDCYEVPQLKEWKAKVVAEFSQNDRFAEMVSAYNARLKSINNK